MKGRVVQVSGLHCLVEFADTQYRCDFRGRVKTGTRGSNAPVIVGDWVDFEPRPPASGVVERRYPRTSKFARGGSATGGQSGSDRGAACVLPLYRSGRRAHRDGD